MVLAKNYVLPGGSAQSKGYFKYSRTFIKLKIIHWETNMGQSKADTAFYIALYQIQNEGFFCFVGWFVLISQGGMLFF